MPQAPEPPKGWKFDPFADARMGRSLFDMQPDDWLVKDAPSPSEPPNKGVSEMDSRYLRPGFDFALAHAIEEAGEFLAAAGKTLRWGRLSVNPELPSGEQEPNIGWLMREMVDLRGALKRLDDALELENGVRSDEGE